MWKQKGILLSFPRLMTCLLYTSHRFHEMANGKSAIFISHRLSSARFTDKVMVLSEGLICEYGSHDELMNIENGVYKNMFQMQAQYYE